MTYRYIGSCVDSTAEDIHAMRDATEDIDFATFSEHADEWEKWAADAGYDPVGSDGLTLAEDWHVSYHRSQYRGRPCIYLVWSAYEHIWVDDASQHKSCPCDGWKPCTRCERVGQVDGVFCGSCWGWGWWPPDQTCAHEWVVDRQLSMHVYVWRCVHCGKENEVDSSG